MSLFNLALASILVLFSQISSDEIIDARLTRQTIGPSVLDEKLRNLKPIENTEMIEGEWEVIASLMTWRDEQSGIVKSTFGYGEYGKDYQISYHFLKENKGTRTSGNKTIDLVWKFTNANKKLYYKNGYGVEEEMWIRMNQDTIEFISSPLEPNSMYMYNVLRRVK